LSAPLQHAFKDGSVVGVGQKLGEEGRARSQVLVVDGGRNDGFVRVDQFATGNFVGRTAGRQLATSVVEPVAANGNVARIHVAVKGVID
jgi:hypothetical protein